MKKLSILLALSLLLAACSNSGSSGTKITVTTEDSLGGPAAVIAMAYQVGDGGWQPVYPDESGAYSFYVPQGETRYGVAVRCGVGLEFGSYSSNTVYQLTTEESTSPLVSCLGTGRFTVVGGDVDVSSVTGATRFEVFGGMESDYENGTADHYSVNVAHDPGADMVVMAFDAGYNAVAARIVRNLGAGSGTVSKDVTLTNADALGSFATPAFSVPAGWSGYCGNTLATAGGTYVSKDMASGNEAGCTFRSVANAGAGDLYMLGAGASDPSDSYQIVQVRMVGATQTAGVTLTPSIEPYSSFSFTLDPLPALPITHPDPGVKLYQVMLFSPYNYWIYQVSGAWLGDADHYYPPNLDDVVGFEGLIPESGDQAMIYVAAIKTATDVADFFNKPHVPGLLPLPRGAGQVFDLAMYGKDYQVP
ncbi:hypothetical protein [Oceanithermus sp.]